MVRIKALCKRAGIARLDGGPKGATVAFHNDKYANPAGLVQFLNDQKGLAKVKDNRIVVRRDWGEREGAARGRLRHRPRPRGAGGAASGGGGARVVTE